MYHDSVDARGVPSVVHALDVGAGALRDFLKIKSLLEQKPKLAHLSGTDFFGVGCLHSIVEDKCEFNGQQISFRSLESIGFPGLWIESLRLLTKLKAEEDGPDDSEDVKVAHYKEFICRIVQGEMTPARVIAIIVKLADLKDNTRPDRYKPGESEEARKARSWENGMLTAPLNQFLFG